MNRYLNSTYFITNLEFSAHNHCSHMMYGDVIIIIYNFIKIYIFSIQNYYFLLFYCKVLLKFAFSDNLVINIKMICLIYGSINLMYKQTLYVLIDIWSNTLFSELDWNQIKTRHK